MKLKGHFFLNFLARLIRCNPDGDKKWIEDYLAGFDIGIDEIWKEKEMYNESVIEGARHLADTTMFFLNQSLENDNRILKNDNRVLKNDNRVLENDNRVLENDNRALKNDNEILANQVKEKDDRIAEITKENDDRIAEITKEKDEHIAKLEEEIERLKAVRNKPAN